MLYYLKYLHILKIPTIKGVKRTASVSEHMHTLTYVVREGDTLTSIARRFHTTVNEIAKFIFGVPRALSKKWATNLVKEMI